MNQKANFSYKKYRLRLIQSTEIVIWIIVYYSKNNRIHETRHSLDFVQIYLIIAKEI